MPRSYRHIKEYEKEILDLKENGLTKRKIAGRTMENLADMLGITKQTVSNPENQRVKMSRIQYRV